MLRQFVLADAAAVAAACRDPEIPRWTFMPEGLTVPQARAWIENAHDALQRARALRLAITDADDGTFLGQVGIGDLDWSQQVGEIFYWVAAARGARRGLARAAKLLSAWAFDVLNLARIEITVDPGKQRVAARRAGRRVHAGGHAALVPALQGRTHGRGDVLPPSRRPVAIVPTRVSTAFRASRATPIISRRVTGPFGRAGDGNRPSARRCAAVCRAPASGSDSSAQRVAVGSMPNSFAAFSPKTLAFTASVSAG